MKFVITIAIVISIVRISFAQINIADLRRNDDNEWITKKTKQPYSGDFIEYYKNGTLKGKGSLAQGIIEGYRVVFDENQDTIFWRNYKNGLAHGKTKEYYPANKLKQEGLFKTGMEDSTWTFYYPTGKKYAIINFKDGKKDGKYIEYNENGNLRTAEWYDDGHKSNFQEAIPFYTEMISVNPSNAQLYFYRGLSYGNSFKNAEALQDYNKAIELNSNYMEAYANRGTEKINLLSKEEKNHLSIEMTKSACDDLYKAKQLGGNKNGELDDLIYIFCEKIKK